MENKKPIKEFRSGQVKASIWENTLKVNEKDINVLNVVIEKAYTDKDGVWKSTNNYGKNDLVGLHLVTQKAIEFICLNNEKND